MTTIQQTLNFSGVRTHPNFALPPISIVAEKNTTSKLGVFDIKPVSSDFTCAAGKPQLMVPPVALNHELMLTQLDGLDNLKNTESLEDLRIAFLTAPAGSKQAITTLQQVLTQVLQREKATTETSVGNRTLLDALEMDDEEQRNLASAALMLLGGALLKETHSVGMAREEENDKVESSGSAKQREFVGIQTNDMMRFLLSMLRQVMAELNISERRINSMFAALSADMIEKAAESTIREGQQIYHSAVIGFATSMAITGVGTGLQAGGLFKQSQAVKNHLKPANQHSADARQLSLQTRQTSGSDKASISRTGPNGQVLKQVTTPSKAEQVQFKRQQQERVNEAQSEADLHMQKYDQQTAKYRTLSGVTEQMTRMSDNAGQLANASNMTQVKEAEADKMMQNSLADVARGIANDKEKQIEKSSEAVKEIRGHVSSLHESTVRAIQSIVKG
ncbi:MAG: IpaC/SipC family type III secretion system effector [Yersinia sp. (in: enterobacteria)]